MAASISVIFSLCGCGTAIPTLNEAWEPAAVDDKLVFRIKKSIYCELVTAVQDIGSQVTKHNGRDVHKLPDGWGAQLTISLQVDETGAVNPSVAFNHYMENGIAPFVGKLSQSLVVPLSGQFSSQASRIDTYYSYFSIDQLRKPPTPFDTSCREYNEQTKEFESLNRRGSSPLLSGKLGIEDWLQGALDAQSGIPNTTATPKSVSSKLDVLSYNIKFLIITAGSVNPTWKLVSLSTGGGMPLLSENRTRTHGLTLTLGPNEAAVAGVSSKPSVAAENVHFNQDLQRTISNGFVSALSAY